MINFASKKLIAFDLDGTLTESKQSLQVGMAQALIRLAEQKKIALISGGSYQQFQKQFLPFWVETLEKLSPTKRSDLNKNLLLLPTSGCQIYAYNEAVGDWQLLAEESFPLPLKTKVKKIFETIIASGEYDLPIKTYGDRLEDRGSQITFSALGQEAPLAQKRLWDPEQIKRQKIREVLLREIPAVDVSIGGMTSIDILPKGFNKAVGLQKLLDWLSWGKDDLLFVGDALFLGGNDYSVKEAGFETIKVSGPDETESLVKKWLN